MPNSKSWASAPKFHDFPPFCVEWKPPGTLGNLELPFCISQGREQVQLDPGLCTQAVLQVLGLVLHGWEGWHQHLRVLLVLLVLPQLLGAKLGWQHQPGGENTILGGGGGNVILRGKCHPRGENVTLGGFAQQRDSRAFPLPHTGPGVD